MSDEYYNHDREGSGFTGLILLLVFMLGGFVVARVHEPGQAVGADMAKERLAKREKIDSASEAKMAGIDEALAKMADYKKGREKLIELSIDKDGKYEPPKEVSDVNLADPQLIANGKLLFQTKTCFTCHQVDPAIPAPAGLAIKAPAFVGDFWGKEREVHIGLDGPVQKVVRDEAYFIESVMKPMAKVAKGALAPMVLAPGLVNDDEVLALMAYVKSLSKTDE
jgi:mono/diheme cytochrome c family protein